MENILSVLESVFKGADARNWSQCESAFAPEVLYDYTSIAGGSPLTLTPKGIIDLWKSFLPGFDRTRHIVFDFVIIESDARFSGQASHFIGDRVWSVTGKYEASLIKNNDGWHITRFKFMLQEQSGDLGLAAEAMERVKGENA